MELRIEVRKRQLYDLFGNPVMASGTNPGNITVIQGVIPNNNWIDITDDCNGIETFELTFTQRRNEVGELSNTPGVSFLDIAASSKITVTGDSYKFIKDWIYDSPTSLYNSFSVRITDVGVGVYEDFVIKRSDITYCENDVCEFSLAVKKENEVYDCIQKTLISDNHQGWFQEQPAGGKQYPRFSYCDEPKNNGGLIITWFLFFVVMVGGITSLLYPIIVIILAILHIIDAIINIGNIPSIPTPGAMNNAVAIMMFRSAGCDREHPAPFIRDYIKNVCDKCGVQVDETTCPVFFATHLTMSTSSGQLTNAWNPHYNATWFHPKYKAGIKRYGNLWENFTDIDPDTTTFFHPENAPKWALSDFLDILKHIYNHDWRIRYDGNGKPTLFFLRKDWFLNGQYIYNFQEGSPDRDKIVRGLCFEPEEITLPAAVDGIYYDDITDSTVANVTDAYNGKAYNFGELTDNNPMYKGVVTKKSDYVEATKFGLDGSDGDYIFDALNVSMNLGLWGWLIPSALVNPIAIPQALGIVGAMVDFIKKYITHSIYLSEDTTAKGRIIIWDGNDMLNARALRDKTVQPIPSSNPSIVTVNSSTLPEPVPNPTYNTTPFNILHPRNTKLRGVRVQYQGDYIVEDFLGTDHIVEPCLLKNFPMYFNPGFKDTLWDWFWFIEDPRFTPRLGMRWTVDVESCAEDRKHLGVYSDTNINLKLGYAIKLPNNFYLDGVIDEITIKYSTDEQNPNRIITLTGKA